MINREFDLFELIRIMLANRKMIILLMVLTSIAAITYSLLTPEIWSSNASFYAVGSGAANLPFDIPGMSGIASQLMGADSDSDALNFVSVLKSRRLSEEVIHKFDLINYFKLNDPDSLANMDDALRLIKKVVSIEYAEKTGLISVSVETKSKKLSKDIVDFYLVKLEEYNKDQKITKGRRNREFLENRVVETRSDIDSLLIALRDFQTKHKAIDINSQSQTLMSSYAQIIAEKMKLEIELEQARSNYGADTPIVKDLLTKNRAISKQIKDLETDKSGLKPQYMIDISSIPDLSERLAQLRLNLEISQKIYEYLYPQFEAARLEELRDMPSIDVLDHARETGRRVRPKRAMICLISVFVAFCFGVFLSIVCEVIQSNKEKIDELRSSLTKK